MLTRLEVLCFSSPAVWQVFMKFPTTFFTFLWDGSEWICQITVHEVIAFAAILERLKFGS